MGAVTHRANITHTDRNYFLWDSLFFLALGFCGPCHWFLKLTSGTEVVCPAVTSLDIVYSSKPTSFFMTSERFVRV